jgi:LmbE family N-acetylglucosaminyl deacetylase
MSTILVVSAHPDDEAIGCAGTIAKHTSSGDEVYLLFMTNGVDSRKNVSNSDTTARNNCAQKAAEFLNVSLVYHLDFPDNMMDSIPLLKIVQAVEDVVFKIEPDVVYTHHISDLNVDHQITHKAVMTACRPTPNFCVQEIYAFEVLSSTEWQTPGLNVFSPNVFIDISSQIKTKHKVLDIYSHEMNSPPSARSIENILRLNSFRGNSVGYAYAEAFMLLRMLKK